MLLPLFLGSVIAYLDRVNLAYAALTMNEDLGFRASVFGFGAGIFFAGYVPFEIPGALIAERWSARIWLARIMVSWGAVSCLMAFVRSEWQFYVIRFLLGAAEASSVPVGCGGGFLGPYFTGVLKNSTGSVEAAYVGLAGSLLAAGLLMLTLRRSRPERS